MFTRFNIMLNILTIMLIKMFLHRVTISPIYIHNTTHINDSIIHCTVTLLMLQHSHEVNFVVGHWNNCSKKKKNRSGAADEGFTNSTLCAAADQCGKEVLDCFHQSRQLRFGPTSVALARYIGSSALRPSSTSAERRETLKETVGVCIRLNHRDFLRRKVPGWLKCPQWILQTSCKLSFKIV